MNQQLSILSSRPFQIIALVVLAIFLLLLLYARTLWNDATETAQSSTDDVELEARGTQDADPLITPTYSTPNVTYTDPVKGASSPTVRIIGYEDYECTHCQNMIEVIDKVVEEYPTTVQYVFKEYPSDDDIDSDSFQAANAARCADKQGSFWAYHNLLFANQFGLDDETYLAIAQSLDLDMDDFQSCVERQTYIPLVRDNKEEADGLLLTGAPYYFINDKEIPGTATFSEFKDVIDSELAEIGDAS